MAVSQLRKVTSGRTIVIYKLIDGINIVFIKFNRWFVANQLIINEMKTKFMSLYRNNKIVSIVLPPICKYIASINRENLFKVFGVVVDVNFKFKEYVLDDTIKISKLIPLIYRIVQQLFFS